MRIAFTKQIDELYSLLLISKDSMCNIERIKRCKYFFEIDENHTLGDYYYAHILAEKKGIVYTPKEISQYIIKNTVKEEDVLNNPFIKILDPCCGAGNIVIELYTYLNQIYMNILEKINKRHGLELSVENIGHHIIKNNLYGVELDETALKILSIELYEQSKEMSLNLYHKDFLIDNFSVKFDIILGNPPYIGTKALDKDYSRDLRNLFNEVYSDKGDISYCFFMKAINSTNKNYKITYITSRYFIESLSGGKLRSYILEKTNIREIVDFYGNRPFKNAGIDPVIIFMDSTQYDNFIVKKPNAKLVGDNIDSSMDTITINAKVLDENPWRLQDEFILGLLKKIEYKCTASIEQVCDTYQGIITGLDKAFILNKGQVEDYNIEKSIIRPWIKSSNIKEDKVSNSDQYIIYSNSIKNEEDYPNAINYIERYKERLLKRRECLQGRRAWYELQWGRKEEIFNSEKIIFPYKSSNNRFLKDKGNYFSADVYSLVIKEDIDITYESLVILLNSSLYEFYFQCFAKKLGGNLYEYYPNNIIRLKIPSLEDISFSNEDEILQYFSFNAKEVEYINSYKYKNKQRKS